MMLTIRSFFKSFSHHVRTPIVLQMEAVECGAAALSIIMGYYKRFVPLVKLRVECGVSRDGSKANHIVKVARDYGLDARGYSKEIDELKTIRLPFIVFWNFNHFLVVEGFNFRKGLFYLNDPASGYRTVTLDEFDQAFTGIVLTFEPGPEFKPGGKRGGVFRKVISRLSGMSFPILYFFVASLLLTLPGLLFPVFTKIFVDQYLVEHLTHWMLPLIIGMGVTTLFRGSLSWIQNHYLIKLEAKLSTVFSSKFFWHVLGLPISFFYQRSTGDINNRITLNDNVSKILANNVVRSSVEVFAASVYLVLMFYYSAFLTLIGIGVASLNIILIYYVGRMREAKSQQIVTEKSKLIGASLNALDLIETLKASGRETEAFSKIAGHQARAINAFQEFVSTTVVANHMPVFINVLNTGVILLIGGLQVMSGTMTIGTLVAFQSLMLSFVSPMNRLVDLVSEVQQLSGDISKLDDVMGHERAVNVNEPVSEKKVECYDLRRLTGKVELKQITFGYSLLAPPLIEGFNLTLTPGARIAVVGPSGSGKSTLAKLLTGLYKPWSGEVLFDQRPASDIEHAVLVSSRAMVDQDIFIFEGTVRDNLTMWDSLVKEETLVQAAMDAEIHSDITSRKRGYDAWIKADAKNFSGGQKQRIEIARALVTDPRILIMDEATSALDPVTEYKIIDNIRRRGCTTLVIAHRLSTIRDCDEIIVLDKGHVVQRGTHDELKTQSGLYATLIGE